MEPTFVDSEVAIKKLIDELPDHAAEMPSLFVDLEGDNLSRHGTISLLTILTYPQRSISIVDVKKLKERAFTTAGSDGRTLKIVLESSKIVKVLFDVRNDSNALFYLFGIHLSGVQDLQLMELASRSFSKRCINGLAKCIENDAGLSEVQGTSWKKAKDKGRRLFDPKLGGSYAVFDARPLSDDIKVYCAQDVSLLPNLWTTYRGKLSDGWMLEIKKESDARIRLSQTNSFNGQGRHMALAPGHWNGLRPRSRDWTSKAYEDESLTSSDKKKNLDTPEPTEKSEDECSDDLSKGMDSLALSLSRHWEAEDDDCEPLRDYTACSADDCGYCGQCDY